MKLTQTEFELRRDRLAMQMGPNSIAIIETSPVAMRNRDSDYKYRADSSFFYLTGFAEPEAVAVIETSDQVEDYNYSLFCRERNRELEIWNGYRAGIDGAIEEYEADEAYAIGLLDEEILDKLAGKQQLYYRIGNRAEFDQQVSQWLKALDANARQGHGAPSQIVQLDRLVDEMRLIKSAAEIKLMQMAADISAEAHTRAMQKAAPNMMEYALEAEVQYVFGQYGALPAYNSIVGGGENACILHYVENDQVLKDGELVLIDAGCEYQFYAGDITRTFPVNGKFTQEQSQLYQLVLDSQYAAIDAVRVGRHYREPHQIVVRILTQGLIELGILHGTLDELIETEAYRQFFMHGTGHWLGMDVHDVGNYKEQGEWRSYQAGMVVTIEPGLYISPDDETVDEKWRGIGIRIEDDVLVTQDGPHVLTHAVVKEIHAIEQLMQATGR